MNCSRIGTSTAERVTTTYSMRATTAHKSLRDHSGRGVDTDTAKSM